MKKLIIGMVLLIVVLAGGLTAAVLTLNSVDWSEYQEPIAAAVKEATGRELRFRGALNVTISLSPAVSARDIVLQNAGWASGQHMLSLEQFDVRLHLLPLIFGRIEVARLELRGLNLELETDRNGRGNWEFEQPDTVGQQSTASPETVLLREAELSQMLVRDVTIRFQDGQTGQQQRIDITEFNGRMATADAPLVFDLLAKVADEPVVLAGQLQGMRGLLAGKPVSVDLAVQALDADIGMTGRIERPLEVSGINISVLAVGQSMRRLAEFADMEFSDPGAWQLAAYVTGDTRQTEIRDLSVALPAMKMTGHLQIDSASELIKLTGQLNATLIDLDSLFPSTEPATEQTETTANNNSGEPERLFPDDLLPVDIFDSVATLDANLELSVTELILDPDTTVRNLQARIQARPNLLLLKPLAFDMQGARLEGWLGLEPADAGMDIQSMFAIRHPRIGDLVDDDDNLSLQGGPLNMEVSINGAGASVREVMAAANGYLRMELGNMQANSLWAHLAFAQVKTLLTSEARVPRKNEPVEFYCLIADFSIDNGVARAVRLVADAHRLSFFGAGQIDLGTEALNLNFDWLAAGLNEKVSLPGLKVRGTLLSPSGNFDTRKLLSNTLGLGDGVVTLDELDQATTAKAAGPERCRQRLGVYQQLSKERARPEQITPESALKDFKNVKKSIRDLKNLFKKKD